MLKQMDQLRRLLDEAGHELAALSAALRQEIDNPSTQFSAVDALHRTVVAERNLTEASKVLPAVNDALETELRNGLLLTHRFAAVTEQERAARHASYHDALTDLPNRALFNDRLEHGIAQAKRHNWSLAVMFLDLDNFKDINDSHGHDVGDSVLKTLADRLKASTRSDDTVARLGGDEFVYMVTELPDDGRIAMVAEKIFKTLHAPITVRARELNIELSIEPSIGIAVFPRDGSTVDTLIGSADAAMYRAKRSNAGYAFATP